MTKRTALDTSGLKATIYGDLMKKMAEDCHSLIRRNLAIAPRPHGPLITQACAVMIAELVCDLSDKQAEDVQLDDLQLTILAALVAARAKSSSSFTEALQEAAADMAVLFHADRVGKHPLEGK